ncbi:hypothetical protein H4Q26_007584 [Puccinia striiformis f. sp. tritici PST-130]|nr:hypothetical protein H4Q26_007584 [Puccinia striiformis f. sp. tritici PST-130]
MAASLNKSTLSISSAGSDDRSSAPAPIPANMLRRHPASLIPRHMHDPVLLGLLKAPVNDDSLRTLAVVATPSDPVQLPTPPSTPNSLTVPDASNGSPVPSLTTFIKLTASQSNAQAPTLLVTLVYLDRLRRRLKGAKAAKGTRAFDAPRLRITGRRRLPFGYVRTLPPDSTDAETQHDGSPGTITHLVRHDPNRLGRQRGSPHNTFVQPIVIRLDTRHVISPSSESSQNKKIRISEVASHSTSTVIKRAKSWYGNLRASTNA